MPLAPGLRVAAAVAVCCAVLTGCSEDAAPRSSATSPDAPVLQPGRPGQDNQTLTGTRAVPSPSAKASPADVRFVQNMIVHHAQALTMVDIAFGGLTDGQVRSLASRIRAEQGPEIGYMKRWLEKQGQRVPPQATNTRMAGGHDPSMPGMASKQQLLTLQNASGPAKDRTFLNLMITHHQGAISMALLRDKSGGTDADIEKLGGDIRSSQGSQITRMEKLRAGLPAA
ncbi:uncharacterized protein (DUF305 family) [Barrientosiimonas humi]|uniref:Uncharacterized protein (DUF305 family) n=1 Tax=Barrientosiimonas humi TaxID=999931 RepID=A0A542XF62_9MICO|nr:DUF305 domain-containing protein [Barrientosiimonas humi]TQL34464.1 uncharacterized protein (DUF305 family) [Barrientosiimonas humi]CAG7574453.1 hypothetical protein BH39T_PBIAJDOK_03105 [Barrientosiimonas humi]